MRQFVGSVVVGLSVVAITFSVHPVRAQCPDTCDTTSGTCTNDSTVTCTSDAKCVGAAVESACPCDGFKNHGQHQKCVVHLRNQLRGDGFPVQDIAP